MVRQKSSYLARWITCMIWPFACLSCALLSWDKEFSYISRTTVNDRWNRSMSEKYFTLTYMPEFTKIRSIQSDLDVISSSNVVRVGWRHSLQRIMHSFLCGHWCVGVILKVFFGKVADGKEIFCISLLLVIINVVKLEHSKSPAFLYVRCS